LMTLKLATAVLAVLTAFGPLARRVRGPTLRT